MPREDRGYKPYVVTKSVLSYFFRALVLRFSYVLSLSNRRCCFDVINPPSTTLTLGYTTKPISFYSTLISSFLFFYYTFKLSVVSFIVFFKFFLLFPFSFAFFTTPNPIFSIIYPSSYPLHIKYPYDSHP